MTEREEPLEPWMLEHAKAALERGNNNYGYIEIESDALRALIAEVARLDERITTAEYILTDAMWDDRKRIGDAASALYRDE